MIHRLNRVFEKPSSQTKQRSMLVGRRVWWFKTSNLCPALGWALAISLCRVSGLSSLLKIKMFVFYVALNQCATKTCSSSSTVTFLSLVVISNSPPLFFVLRFCTLTSSSPSSSTTTSSFPPLYVCSGDRAPESARSPRQHGGGRARRGQACPDLPAARPGCSPT